MNLSTFHDKWREKLNECKICLPLTWDTRIRLFSHKTHSMINLLEQNAWVVSLHSWRNDWWIRKSTCTSLLHHLFSDLVQIMIVSDSNQGGRSVDDVHVLWEHSPDDHYVPHFLGINGSSMAGSCDPESIEKQTQCPFHRVSKRNAETHQRDWWPGQVIWFNSDSLLLWWSQNSLLDFSTF